MSIVDTVAPPMGVQRLLATTTASAGTHEARLGPLPMLPSERLVAELERSGLDGRGGGGFPLGRKLRATLDATTGATRARHAPLVIANGAEGESASRKDALLLTEAPHLVLDGLLLVARALGADEAVLATTADRAAMLAPAIAARTGELGRGERSRGERSRGGVLRTEVVPHAFVSGEATALASRVTGGAGRPLDHPIRLARRGPDGRPTFVANVETLAAAALIARFGADWFRSIGSASAPGTRLVTVSGGAERTVLEVAGGTPLDMILRAAGVDPGTTRAVLVGGHGGTWVPRAALASPFDPDGLRPWGASPGAGILVPIGPRTCGLRTTAHIAASLAGASAGQCGPCVNGLPRMADVLGALADTGGTGRRADPRLRDEVLRVAALVDGRGACHHPDGVARLVRSAMAVFRDDVDAHLDGRCTA